MVSPPPEIPPREKEPVPRKTHVPIKEPVPIQRVKPIQPIQPVAVKPVAPMNFRMPEPEAQKQQPEVQTSPPAKVEAKKPDLEEKTSIQKKKLPEPEEKASTGSKNRKERKFNGGGGRIHTEAQIDQILDWYLETGELPDYVSERQRHSYKHHIRLPERRELLDKQQINAITGDTSNQAGGDRTASSHKNNITKLPRTGTHHP